MSHFFDFEKHPKALPVAAVAGGSLKNKVLYACDAKVIAASKKLSDIDVTPYAALLKGYTPREKTAILRRVQEAFVKGIDEEHYVGDAMEKTILKAMNETAEGQNTKVSLPPESSFRLIHTDEPKVRQIFYVAGPSGSGKSWIARGIAESYRKAFPDRKVFLISQLEEDETLDNMKGGKPIRLKLPELVANPPTLNDMRENLFIFDDYDTLPKAQLAVVEKMIDEIAIQGRHKVISMCCLSHYLTNYKKTRLLLMETTNFVVYPTSTGTKALSYLLCTHVGMDPKEIVALKKLGRWVMVSRQYPQYLVSEHTAMFLTDF